MSPSLQGTTFDQVNHTTWRADNDMRARFEGVDLLVDACTTKD
jgi:hypothetical protein